MTNFNSNIKQILFFRPFSLFLFFLGIIISGCVAPPYRHMIPIESYPLPVVENSILYISEQPEKVTLQFYSSNTSQIMGGGLLFDLIDIANNSSRKSTSEAIGSSIKQILEGYDLEGKIAKLAKQTFDKSNWPKIAEIKEESQEIIDREIKDGTHSVTSLKITPYINPEFSFLSIKSVLEIYQAREGHLKGKNREPIYRYTFDDVVNQLEETGTASDNANLWTVDRLYSSLDNGLKLIFSKIEKGLNDPTVVP